MSQIHQWEGLLRCAGVLMACDILWFVRRAVGQTPKIFLSSANQWVHSFRYGAKSRKRTGGVLADIEYKAFPVGSEQMKVLGCNVLVSA
jgi:hypothetical protein